MMQARAWWKPGSALLAAAMVLAVEVAAETLDADAARKLTSERTWWAKSYGMTAACFRVSSAGEGRFEALQDNGLPLFSFWLED